MPGEVGAVGLTTFDLDAARRLDPLGITRVYEELAPAVHRFFVAALGDTTVAEELTGRVFLAVVARLGHAPADPARLHSWVLGLALGDLRTYRSRSAPGRRVGAPAPTVALLDRLPHDQRDVLALRLGAGLTVAEIARILAVSADVVWSLQQRALTELAALLDGPIRRDGQEGGT
jgi:RNA polymerase sigma-70 factor, ECF subfamily